MVSQPILSRQLIGRQQHVAVVQGLVAQVVQGAGGCLLLAGEAGIGKSRLLAETKKLAEGAGVVVLQGNCYEPDQTFPYAPLIDLLRGVALVEPFVGALAPVAHELARLFPPLQKITAVPLVTSGEQEKRQLFTALTTFFTQLAATRPLLLVFEDVHWGDDASLEWLLAFSRHVGRWPVLLLLTYRSDEVTAELRHLLAELDRQRVATELLLVRLSMADTQAMMASIFAQQQPVQADFAATVYQLTDGNPFFIEEVLKSLVVAGDIFQAFGGWTRKPLEALQIPRSVEDAVQRRTRVLSPMAQGLLQLTAVAGRRFDFHLLQRLTPHDEPTLLGLLKELMAAQLVVEETADRFAFRHALTRQAVYHQLLRRERRVLHQTIAETLEGLGAVPLAELAYHFFAAESWEKAVAYGRRAGEQAQGLFVPRAAAEQFTRALQASEQLGWETAVLHHARGQAYDRLGEFELARADYEAAQRLAAGAGQWATAWQSLLDLGFLWVGQDYPKAGMLLEQALAMARQIGNGAILGQTLNRIGNWHLMTEREELSTPYHREALGLFETLDDRRGVATSLDLLGISHFMHGDMAAGAVYYERAIGLWRQLGERQWLISSLASYATRGGNCLFPTAVAHPTPLAICRAEVEEALQLAQTIGWLNGEATALIWYGALLVPRGEFAQALQVTQQALELAEELGHRLWRDTAHSILGMAYLELGAWERAEHHLELALQGGVAAGSPTVIHSMAGLYARVLLAQGRLDEAERVLAAWEVGSCRMQGQHHLAWARVEWLLARQTPSLALPLVAEMVDALGGESRVGSVVWWLHGELLLALERFREAEPVLLEACQRAAAYEHWPVAWRSWAALARLYGARGRWREMEEAVGRVEEVVGVLAGKTAVADLVHSLRQLVASKLPPPPLQKRVATHKLTRREREVAVLLAQGNSNAAIAETLVLSERTIEKHVENIMNKLGFNSRVQIAAWLVGQS